MAFAGLLLVMGLRAGKDWAPASAVVLEVAVVALAAHLALARRRRRPMPRWLPGLLGCLALFYLASGLAAAMAGTRYLPIVLLAALIPTAAVLLMLATVRVKPAPANEDRHADPYPGSAPTTGRRSAKPPSTRTSRRESDRGERAPPTDGEGRGRS
jgi:hypothetical protein